MMFVSFFFLRVHSCSAIVLVSVVELMYELVAIQGCY